MDNELIFTDPHLQSIMIKLGIQESDLTLHDVSFFPGNEREQKLRYEHHCKMVQKLVRIIHRYQNYEKKSSNLEVQKESKEQSQDYISKLKEKVKLNLLIHYNLVNNKREILNKSFKKSLRVNEIKERKNSALMKKREKDLRKKEEFQKRINEILKTQKEKSKHWIDKLSRNSSNIMSSTPRISAKYRLENSANESNAEISDEELKRMNEKQEKSLGIYERVLRYKSEKSALHNEQVAKTYESYLSLSKDINEQKLYKFIEKTRGLNRSKIKKTKIINENLRKLVSEFSNKLEKVRGNLSIEGKKKDSKVEKIERKFQTEKNNLDNYLNSSQKEKEIKSLKNILKNEETSENLKWIKRERDIRKEELLDKNIQNSIRLNQRNLLKEKQNMKARAEAYLANQELVRQKALQLKIQNAESPDIYNRIIQTFK